MSHHNGQIRKQQIIANYVQYKNVPVASRV